MGDDILRCIMSLRTIFDSDVHPSGSILLIDCVPSDVIWMGHHPLGHRDDFIKFSDVHELLSQRYEHISAVATSRLIRGVSPLSVKKIHNQ